MQIKDQDFVRLHRFIKEHYGINLEQKRTLIEGRLSNFIERRGFADFTSYIDAVFNDRSGGEMATMLTKLTTNYTYFMREPGHFKFLTENALPWIMSEFGDRDLRIWSAGCSSGEEPYTIAMVVQDFFGFDKKGWETTLLATDISDKVLDEAIKGVYGEDKLTHAPQAWLKKYFNKVGGDAYEVKDTIKKEVVFRKFNLMEQTFPFRKKFQVIFCRNVMIYFDSKQRSELVQRYYDALEQGGYLFIGLSESLYRTNSQFRYVMPSIYRKG